MTGTLAVKAGLEDELTPLGDWVIALVKSFSDPNALPLPEGYIPMFLSATATFESPNVGEEGALVASVEASPPFSGISAEVSVRVKD